MSEVAQEASECLYLTLSNALNDFQDYNREIFFLVFYSGVVDFKHCLDFLIYFLVG